jgi:hypothetical protein
MLRNVRVPSGLSSTSETTGMTLRFAIPKSAPMLLNPSRKQRLN